MHKQGNIPGLTGTAVDRPSRVFRGDTLDARQDWFRRPMSAHAARDGAR